MINFNQPPYTSSEDLYVLQAMRSSKISGNGIFTQKCQLWFENNLPCKKALLTPSCTAALEMAALLINIQPEDEVIMPSYTFVSTANAFVLRGAKIVFVDIRPDTMNIDENLIEAAITSKTKAIVPVHYAGIACEMDVIMEIANRHKLYVIEDAAQGMRSYYKGKSLGTIGHFGTYSFHETKNYTSGGEGGLLIVNDDSFNERAEIIREKGTNRSKFFRGQVNKYSWMDIGSSYLPSELQTAYLWGQLENTEVIKQDRLTTWNAYFESIAPLASSRLVELPHIPKYCEHNAHMFFLKLKNLDERTSFIEHLKNLGVTSVFHYIPLHNSVAGKKFGRFHGKDMFTSQESERLVRLPLYYGLSNRDFQKIISSVESFFRP
ncbi:dTDP-4-amino-4,6-dideoxygalactose transaminase [Vreelandella populi]|nr:dTDP-4-amino-4,6-dideoxygalactose transaminase [Halomonas populi]